MAELAKYLEERLGPPSSDAAPGSVSVTSEDLENLWTELVPDSFAGRRGMDAFLDAVEAQAGRSAQADLHFRPGGWQIDVHRGAVQTIVASALIAGLLTAVGASQIPAALVTAVVPLFFAVEKVRLTPGQRSLLAELVGYQAALDGTATARDLYGQLPAETRGQLSLMDFTDFLDKCRRAGFADAADDGTVTLRPADQGRFRITLC